MKPMYVIEEGSEYIVADNYRSVDYEPLTLFFDFFDMIRNKDKEFATYEVLLALEDNTMSYEQACEYVPILRLADNSINGVWQMIVSDFITIHEAGKIVLEEALLEQRTYEESLFKTLFIRQNDGKAYDRDFLGRFDIRKYQEPITTFGDFISANINYLNNNVVCCGKCDKCSTFYPIYRGGRSLYKNHFCPVCRNTVSGALSKQKAKNSPIYTAYQSIYNKYYQQFKRLNKITYEQFKAYMVIAGNIRDTFLANGNDDVAAYQEEVKRQIAAWTYK